MSLSNNWHLISLNTDFGLRYIMMRRTPIIDLSTGEVLASLHVGIVLNNNFSLASAVKHGSNTDNVVIAVGSKVVASTVRDKENYTSQDLLNNFTENHDQTRFLVAKTDIAINAKPTFISIYSIQNNEHVALLTRSHYFWLFVAFISMFVLAVSTRFWLGRKVSHDLTELMNYTVNAVEHRKLDEYKGSSISEFQQIGEALELTFQRLTNKERQFQDLFNFSLLPIMFWDMNGRVMKMNLRLNVTLTQAKSMTIPTRLC
ncbi:LuxQ periplasmic sensor domain-containing protein [Vibrio mexicanus]|uniref:LuxQ periplasmic sensor domain-containing protein n=1 Tax=Vibrio mexicanus TaxID=1004326 RepID=UPI000B04259E